jgi:N-dimethylarginine dimethylaminohydrolase
MRKLLLCPPQYYSIEYEINPWMHRSRDADHGEALKQWEALTAQLSALGCSIETLAPQDRLPDLVFTANAGLVVGRQFIRSNFRYPQRRGEQPVFEEWFNQNNYEIVRLPQDMYFEGEGDALFAQDVLFCGYKFRSDIRAHQRIAEILKCLVISVELVDDRFYHLDTCFCPLPDDSAIWFPPAFDDYARRAIRKHIPNLLEVAPDEALNFACNAVVSEREIVLPDGCPKLCSALSERGFHVHALPMSEFLKAGGACKCLTLFLPQKEN